MIARVLRVFVFGFAFLFVMVNVHEIGHTIFARLLGDESAHYVLYQAQGEETPAWAATCTTPPGLATLRTRW